MIMMVMMMICSLCCDRPGTLSWSWCSAWVVAINEQQVTADIWHHGAPFIAPLPGLWSERERAHFRPVSATRRPRHFRWLLIGRWGWSRDLNTGLWLADDGSGADGCGEIHSPWWWRCYRWCYRGWKHTLSMSLSFISSLMLNWKNTTHIHARLFTSLHMCFPDNMPDKQQMCRLITLHAGPK